MSNSSSESINQSMTQCQRQTPATTHTPTHAQDELSFGFAYSIQLSLCLTRFPTRIYAMTLNAWLCLLWMIDSGRRGNIFQKQVFISAYRNIWFTHLRSVM